GALMRRLEGGGAGAAPAAMGDATSSPGRTRAASSATMEPARSDHGQRHKGQDAALARRKARGVTFHAHRPEQSGQPARSNPGIAPCRRADPLVCEGDGSSGTRATPWPRAANRGRYYFESMKMHGIVGWAKALARPSTRMRDSRAPCPRRHNSQLRKTAWARRTRDFGLRHRTADAFAHPTIPVLDDFGKTKPSS